MGIPNLSRMVHLLTHPTELRERWDARSALRQRRSLERNWKRLHAPRLREFSNRHENGSCFIIGNGPSLNRMDLAPLKDRICFGLNKVHLLKSRFGLDVNYHVAVNPLVIEQCSVEFLKLAAPSFVSMQAARACLPHGPRVFYLFSRPELAFMPDVTRGVSEGWTVTYVAMQLAYYMGFKSIFLVGVDHSFSTKGARNETQHMAGPDPNHFDPTYFSGAAWHLPDLEGSEMAYRMARFVFERDNREILDATVGGQLTVFEKIDYETALERTV